MVNRSGDRSNLRGLVLLMLTSGLFITGLLFDYMPTIVDSQIKRTVELATNEEIKAIWSKPPVDIHSYYWLYDVLNSELFLQGEKVRVRKVGPFHITGRLEKKIIELSPNKFRLIYNSTSHLRLNESDLEEQRLLDEPLVLLNPVHATMLEATRETARELGPDMRVMVQSSANRLTERFNETLFLNLTARQALLGRKLLLLSKARKLAETFGLKARLPNDVLANDMFGYVAILNDTWRGPFEIYTGYQATVNSLGDLISYQGRRRLQEYRGKCNRIQASLGELRPMPIGEDQLLELYYPEFCRILHLKPNGVRKLREGLAISYSVAPEDLASARTNPDKSCFCLNGTTDDYCSLEGALELAPCNNYSPLVATIRGVEPDERILNSIADFEPELLASDVEMLPPADNSSQMMILKRIGVPLRADLTITLFMKVIRDPSFSSTVNVPPISYVPLVMVRVMAVIPPSLGQLILNLESFLALANHLKVIMYLSTIVLLCWLTGEYYSSFAADRVQLAGGLPSDGSEASSLSLRANSADSTRSQPPSRLSHGSLDAAAATSFASADSQAPRQLVASELVAAGERENKTGGRIFSKVDEELALKRAKQETRSPHSNQVHPNVGQSGQPQVSKPAGSKRSWFVRVSLRFVRMLNELRESISDASQLEASENNYQDRQLELLAGKIDNWYSNNTGNSPGEPPVEQPGDETRAEAPAASGAQTLSKAESPASGETCRKETTETEPISRTEDGRARDSQQDRSSGVGQLVEPARESKPAGEDERSRRPTDGSGREKARIHSGQSSQTVMNRSDTSGDETGSVLLARDDKTSALERLERALDTPSSEPAAAKPIGETKPTINSSATISELSRLDTEAHAQESGQIQGRRQAPGSPVPNQSTKSNNNNQFDESSSKQLNKLGPNGVVASSANQLPPVGLPASADIGRPADLGGRGTNEGPSSAESANPPLRELNRDDAPSGSQAYTSPQAAVLPSIKPSGKLADMQPADETGHMMARLEEPKLASPVKGHNSSAAVQNGNGTGERKLQIKGRLPLMGRAGANVNTSVQLANGIGNNISNVKAAIGQARG